MPSLKFLFFVVLVGCTTTPAPKEPGHNLTKEQQTALDEYKAEVEIGRNMAARLLQFYGTVDSEEIVTYVNTVGNFVAQFSDAADRRYMFAVLDNESINAFACPGGYILVTLGAIRNAREESELAMILGHEVAHVGKKHMFNTLKSMNQKDREKNAKEVDAKGSLITDSMQYRRRPDPEDKSEMAALLARYLSGSQSGLVILQAAKAGMSVILEKGLDKELEFEADQEGVKYAIRAGYDPNGLVEFLNRMEESKKSQGADLKILEKTHPQTKDRLERIQDLLAKLESKTIVGAHGKERFEQFYKRLPVLKKQPLKK